MKARNLMPGVFRLNGRALIVDKAREDRERTGRCWSTAYDWLFVYDHGSARQRADVLDILREVKWTLARCQKTRRRPAPWLKHFVEQMRSRQ